MTKMQHGMAIQRNKCRLILKTCDEHYVVMVFLMIFDFSYFIFNVELLFCRVEHDRGKWFPLKTWLTQVIHYSLRIVLLPFGVAIVVFTVITKKKLQSNLVVSNSSRFLEVRQVRISSVYCNRPFGLTTILVIMSVNLQNCRYYIYIYQPLDH
jgi:hypothetical protein